MFVMLMMLNMLIYGSQEVLSIMIYLKFQENVHLLGK